MTVSGKVPRLQKGGSYDDVNIANFTSVFELRKPYSHKSFPTSRISRPYESLQQSVASRYIFGLNCRNKAARKLKNANEGDDPEPPRNMAQSMAILSYSGLEMFGNFRASYPKHVATSFIL